MIFRNAPVFTASATLIWGGMSLLVSMPAEYCLAAPQRAAPAEAAAGPVFNLPSLRDSGKWKPRHFFDDDWACAICDAINDKDMAQLRRLIDGDFELGTTGKAGVTVLHWALFEDNLEAFKILLEAGADPDVRLTDFLRFELQKPLVQGDTILFIALRKFRYRFFVAAFKYTKDPRQLDASGENLLLAYICPGVGYDAEVVNTIARGGVDMNMTTRGGSSAARLALSWLNAKLCLELLKAGVDPTICDSQGRTVGDVVDSIIARDGTVEVSREMCREIREWIDAQSAKTNEEGNEADPSMSLGDDND